jgi:predicted patatin/cPLA2 family phospholipase
MTAMERVRDKTAIILVGGAMKSIHGAGFLYAYAARLGLPSPDIIIGTSGDAGTVAYFCAGQLEAIKRIWLKLLSTPKFISLWRLWRIMDVDYLIDVVFKTQEPLDTNALRRSSIDWYIPITDFDTGKTLYISKRDSIDPFETLRAAKAIPILFGKKILLAPHRYIDGELGPILQDHVEKALSLGATKIVVLNHTEQWTRLNSLPIRLYAYLCERGMQDAIMRDISTDVTAYHSSAAQVILLSPTNLPCGTVTHNPQKLEAAFLKGAEDAERLAGDIRKLFERNVANVAPLSSVMK